MHYSKFYKWRPYDFKKTWDLKVYTFKRKYFGSAYNVVNYRSVKYYAKLNTKQFINQGLYSLACWFYAQSKRFPARFQHYPLGDCLDSRSKAIFERQKSHLASRCYPTKDMVFVEADYARN